jgi:hypothetical protein
MQTHSPIAPLETLIAEQQSLLQSLSGQVQSLRQEVAHLRSAIAHQPTLGFSDGRDYISIERDKNILWHRFENDEPVPVKSKLLKGYLTRIAYIEKEYPKLHVFIRGDREYVLVSGIETHFSRELLAAISTLKPEDLQYPLIIKPDTGTEEGESKSKHKPVFCNLFNQGRLVKPGGVRNLEPLELFRRAEAVLQGKTQPTESEKAINWGQVRQELGITPDELKDLARTLDLPMGKLTSCQAELLLREAYTRYRKAAS